MAKKIRNREKRTLKGGKTITVLRIIRMKKTNEHHI